MQAGSGRRFRIALLPREPIAVTVKPLQRDTAIVRSVNENDPRRSARSVIREVFRAGTVSATASAGPKFRPTRTSG